MSNIPPAVSQLLQARTDATRQEIDIALIAKNLDAQKQAGDAVNALLQQAANMQQQLNDGHIDVRL